MGGAQQKAGCRLPLCKTKNTKNSTKNYTFQKQCKSLPYQGDFSIQVKYIITQAFKKVKVVHKKLNFTTVKYSFFVFSPVLFRHNAHIFSKMSHRTEKQTLL